MPYLQLAGFKDVALVWKFDLRVDLISVLVERWRSKTRTFHMSCEECTIILEDVTIQRGLQVDGDMGTGRSNMLEHSVVCNNLLEQSLGDGEHNFTTLTFSWLRANFKDLSSTTTENEFRCATRVYIL